MSVKKLYYALFASLDTVRRCKSSYQGGLHKRGLSALRTTQSWLLRDLGYERRGAKLFSDGTKYLGRLADDLDGEPFSVAVVTTPSANNLGKASAAATSRNFAPISMVSC